MKISKIIVLFAVAGLLFSACKTSSGQVSKALNGLEDGLYAEMKTDKGDILLRLEYERVPGTVANFVSLAEGNNPRVSEEFKGKHFYDGLTFHRVIKNFMIQGGDPTAKGNGGPGYQFDDEFPRDDKGQLIFKHDRPGILSMANSGPNTNGSQFFITHVPTPWLDGKHSIFGSVVTGQEVVDSIAKGDVIQKVTILRKGKQAEKFDAPAVFENFLAEAKDRRKRELEEQEKRKQRSIKFIAEMAADISAKKEKAKKLPSGVRIFVEEPGNDVRPADGEMIYVDYAGFFEDGHLFDTSIVSMAQNFDHYNPAKDRAGAYKPMKVPYSEDMRIIQGLKEALLTMHHGEKAMVFIPSDLAYGERGAGNGIIPPNTDLVFVVHILE